MGSLPEGTLCSYCGAREASYIPDGACGPVCFKPAGTCCWDVAAALGWRHIEMQRLNRFACASIIYIDAWRGMSLAGVKTTSLSLQSLSTYIYSRLLSLRQHSMLVKGSYLQSEAETFEWPLCDPTSPT